MVGTDVTWGAAFPTGDNLDAYGYEIGLAMLDGSRFLIAYRSSLAPKSRVGTVSGSNIAFGAVHSFPAATVPMGVACASLGSSKAVVAFSDYNSGAYDGKVAVATVSGTDITYGAASGFGSGLQYLNIAIEALDSGRCAMYWQTTADARAWVAVVTVSGAGATVGAALELASNAVGYGTAIAVLSQSKFVVGYSRSIDNNSVWLRVCEASGAVVTAGAGVEIASTSVFGDMAAMDSDKVVVFYRNVNVLGNRPQLNVGTVSGLTVSLGGASTPFPLPGGNDSYPLSYAVCAPDAATVVAAVRRANNDCETAVGKPGVQASLAAPTPGAYPTAVGATRVVAAMWAKKLTAGSSTVTVERGYRVDMTATSVSLGGTTAVWNDAGIAALMAAMNAGSSHLLVMDFENTGGTAWNLRTSIDGAAWTDQGAQDSGTQAVATMDTAPRLDIASGEAGQWIDELVMWAGDKSSFAPFKTEELVNLYDLADVFGDPMDQYEEDYGAPICWQATARMPDGSVWRDSGSGPCPPVVRVPRGASDVVVTDDGMPASPRVVEG